MDDTGANDDRNTIINTKKTRLQKGVNVTVTLDII